MSYFAPLPRSAALEQQTAKRLLCARHRGRSVRRRADEVREGRAGNDGTAPSKRVDERAKRHVARFAIGQLGSHNALGSIEAITVVTAEELPFLPCVGRATPGVMRPAPHLAARRVRGHPGIEGRPVGLHPGKQRRRLLKGVDLVVRILPVRHAHRRAADYLDVPFGAFLDAGVDKSFKRHVLKTYLPEIVAGQHRLRLLARSSRQAAVLQRDGKRVFLPAVEAAKGLHAEYLAVLKGDGRQRTVAAPLAAAVEVKGEEPGRMVKRAVAEDDVFRTRHVAPPEIAVVGKAKPAVAQRLAVVHGPAFVLRRKLPTVPERAGGDHAAPFKKTVPPAKARGAAGTVENGVAHGHAFVAESGDGIVAHVELARGNDDVGRSVRVETVMPAVDAHLLDLHVGAAEERVGPVGAVAHGISLQRHVRTPGETDRMGPAIALLAVRIEAVASVDHAVASAHDGDVLRAVCAQKPAVPGTRLARVGVVGAVRASLKRRAVQKPQRHAALELKAARTVNALRHDDLAAARPMARIDCRLDVGRHEAVRHPGAEIDDVERRPRRHRAQGHAQRRQDGILPHFKTFPVSWAVRRSYGFTTTGAVSSSSPHTR